MKSLHGGLNMSEFSNLLSLILGGQGKVYHQSAYDFWKRRGGLIKVVYFVQFRSIMYTGRWHKNHIFLVFDKWGHQHQIIFYILYTTWFAIEGYLLKEGQTQHIHEEKEGCYHWFWTKRGEKLLSFIKMYA